MCDSRPRKRRPLATLLAAACGLMGLVGCQGQQGQSGSSTSMHSMGSNGRAVEASDTSRLPSDRDSSTGNSTMAGRAAMAYPTGDRHTSQIMIEHDGPSE